MYKDLYNARYYKLSKKYQLSTQRFRLAIDGIKELNAKRVLDVGCGLGILVRILRAMGIEAYGLDFAQTLKDDYGLKEDYFIIGDAKSLPFEDGYFDVVVSTDFFEHLAEDEIDIVLKEMKRVGKNVFANVAPYAPLTERQMKFHQTNKPMAWWKEKLKDVRFI